MPAALLALADPFLTAPAHAQDERPGILRNGGRLVIATNREVTDPRTVTTTRGFASEARSGRLTYALVHARPGPALNQATRLRLIGRDELESAMGGADGQRRPVLLYVHGFNNTMEEALRLAVRVADAIEFDGNVVVFSWPSRGSWTPASYRADALTADASKAEFRSLMGVLDATATIERIDVLAHSLGNRIFMRSMTGTGAPAGPAKIGQVVFCSPDVEREEFISAFGEVARRPRGATLWASNNDRALSVAPVFGGGTIRAGLIDERGPIVLPSLATIDVSGETGFFAVNHNAYMQVNDLFADLKDVFSLTAERPWLNPAKREHYAPLVLDGSGTYWQYRQ